MNLTASQDRLRKLRDTLGATKESITKRGGDLSISLNRSQQYKEMLRLLQVMFASRIYENTDRKGEIAGCSG